jgi:hypothetical protein
VPKYDQGRWHQPGEDPDLDALFDAARGIARRGVPPVDVDRVIAVAAAAIERRRARRLIAMRVTGVALILAVLAVWLVSFSHWGTDVLYTVVMFAVPALMVLRWHMASLDGGGLRPWRTPSTVAAWSQEATHRVDELATMIGQLERLELRLEMSAAALTSSEHAGEQAGLPVLIMEAGGAVARVRTRLADCRAGAEDFIKKCRTAPGKANWRLLRELDPTAVPALLQPGLTKLDLVVAHCSELSGQNAPLTLELYEARRETKQLAHSLGRRCSKLIEAFDTLHRLATQQTLEQIPVLGVVRRAMSPAAVVISGWGRPAVERSAIRNQLLEHAPNGGPSWGPTVRRARAVARQELLTPAGGH